MNVPIPLLICRCTVSNDFPLLFILTSSKLSCPSQGSLKIGPNAVWTVCSWERVTQLYHWCTMVCWHKELISQSQCTWTRRHGHSEWSEHGCWGFWSECFSNNWSTGIFCRITTILKGLQRMVRSSALKPVPSLKRPPRTAVEPLWDVVEWEMGSMDALLSNLLQLPDAVTSKECPTPS